MKLILLSGGSGKRLWPMSNDARSKQFLKVMKDQGTRNISMLQRVWGQLGKMGLQQSAFVCASASQRDVIEGQIGQIPLIEEPSRRDTFPAIALAVSYLSDIEGQPDNEVVTVLPVDHLVNDEYFRHISKLQSVIDSSMADIVLMGVKPTEPSGKFGYIRVGSAPQSEGAYGWKSVDSFVEKPSIEVATHLISEGALWNCGIFCFRIGFIKNILEKMNYPQHYNSLVRDFHTLPQRSFDYEVVEKTENIVVSTYSGIWRDLGTWDSIASVIEDDFIGRGLAVDCENTNVINELGIPVIALGLTDLVVVSSPDGILVADKTRTSQIKDLVGQYDDRPMFEERRWGSYRVLDYQKTDDGTEVVTRSIELKSGRNLSYQKHYKRSEIWAVIEGHGEFALDGSILPLSAGDVVQIAPGQLHAVRAMSSMRFIEVQRGSELVEEDVIRQCLEWNEIEFLCAVDLV